MNARRKLTTAVLLCLILPEGAGAQEADDDGGDQQTAASATLHWQDYYASRQLPPGGKLEQDPTYGAVLTIDGSASEQHSIHLATINNPEITQDSYHLKGMIRYEGVSEPAFLEMWNHFGDRGSFFTRTLGQWGPMGLIQGDSKWRPVSLPFIIGQGESHRPERLEINLVLPAEGRVQISDLELIEGVKGAVIGGAFWSSPGGVGTLCGLLGALFGVLGSVYAWSRQSGRGWAFLRFLPVFFCVVAVGSLALSATLVLLDWPWHFGLCAGLLGAIMLLATIGNGWLKPVRDELPGAEVRRMQSLDA